ncbi:MAG TPA: cyanophycin synthetase, partial [bacterium]|nr:cyanophycin synthetase [bacterium]
MVSQVKRRVVTYGLTAGVQVQARKVKYEKAGSVFEVALEGERLGAIRLGVPGRFNIQNALAAVSVALELKVPFKAIAAGLAKFHGAQRRFEVKGTYKGAVVVDDYAHHPTAVAETLTAAKRFAGNKKLVVVFQPHLYSRTQLLRDKFGKAFADADEVLVTAVYPSREKPIPGVTGKTLVEAIRENGHPSVQSFEDRTALMEYLKAHLTDKHVLLTMGAGDVWKLGQDLVQKHKG